jgi:hypothetical protein
VETVIEIPPRRVAVLDAHAPVERDGELAAVRRDQRHLEHVFAAVPDLELVRRGIAGRNDPVEDVTLRGADARVRVHGAARVVADALHEHDPGLLEHRVHRALER